MTAVGGPVDSLKCRWMGTAVNEWRLAGACLDTTMSAINESDAGCAAANPHRDQRLPNGV